MHRHPWKSVCCCMSNSTKTSKLHRKFQKYLFNGGSVANYLKKVKTFLDANPNEVLTLLFTNPEGLSVKDLWKPAFDNSSITPLIYIPPTIPLKQSDWPTLGVMIDSGKRVLSSYC
ncbi:uncharacterized protein LACBIDRAFT_308204 [Laccaria bicolor S238N-H82]|uniref:Predicted protein n=1 Tax=Laccaria bicolor (strain S238N-H82 / ATCC MYA-4686) TaxID=486041 RepID=B0DRU1_LACBS|nr:uncharacterized protein LACBIDRAFT_308204 [Laccaria bicolor S238N-H82]EDR02590.1 predicted protein [Laccaria bicolor S238N-H82]|eukprot:XP_001886634.1 predicted protein [Laccaria bicolor S238N-H82]